MLVENKPHPNTPSYHARLKAAYQSLPKRQKVLLVALAGITTVTAVFTAYSLANKENLSSEKTESRGEEADSDKEKQTFIQGLSRHVRTAYKEIASSVQMTCTEATIALSLSTDPDNTLASLQSKVKDKTLTHHIRSRSLNLLEPSRLTKSAITKGVQTLVELVKDKDLEDKFRYDAFNKLLLDGYDGYRVFGMNLNHLKSKVQKNTGLEKKIKERISKSKDSLDIANAKIKALKDLSNDPSLKKTHTIRPLANLVFYPNEPEIALTMIQALGEIKDEDLCILRKLYLTGLETPKMVEAIVNLYTRIALNSSLEDSTRKEAVIACFPRLDDKDKVKSIKNKAFEQLKQQAINLKVLGNFESEEDFQKELKELEIKKNKLSNEDLEERVELINNPEVDLDERVYQLQFIWLRRALPGKAASNKLKALENFIFDKTFDEEIKLDALHSLALTIPEQQHAFIIPVIDILIKVATSSEMSKAMVNKALYYLAQFWGE